MSGWGNTAVRIADDVAWTSGGSRVVAMDLATPGAAPFVLETSAAVIWEEIAADGPIRTRELLDRLSAAFEIDEDEIRADVEALLSDLVTRGLLAA
ncbi:PqqD family protein [Microbacterium sp. NPDC058345]|uniref:PqqD family protein n=1 Tax=Microbacterium sp. NPDC058345 TaxID=3346455 RepID=UPI0036696D62